MHKLTLLTHRVADVAPTGIGRYVRGVIEAAPHALGDRWRIAVGAGPEPGEPELGTMPVHRLPGPRPLVQNALAAGLPWRWDARLGRPDLVHQLNAWAPVPTRAPQILTVHDLMPLEHPEWFASRHRWRFRRTLRWAVTHRARFVCDSHHVASLVQRLLEVPAARVEVVHPGLDEAFRTGAAEGEVDRVCAQHGLEPGRYLLSLGVMSAREDPSALIAALGRCRAELGERALVLTGPERFGADGVRRAAQAAGVEGRVHLAGFVPEADLVPLLSGAAALVHPSHDEGFGFTPLEAMACGVPVIASSAGSLPEIVDDAGLLVEPGDVGGWADAIDTVLTTAGVRDDLVARGQRRQDRFRWRETALALGRLYDDVIGV